MDALVSPSLEDEDDDPEATARLRLNWKFWGAKDVDPLEEELELEDPFGGSTWIAGGPACISGGFIDSKATAFLGDTAALVRRVRVSRVSVAIGRGRGGALGLATSARFGAGIGLDLVIAAAPFLDLASVEVLRDKVDVLRDKVEVLRDKVDVLRDMVEVLRDKVDIFAAFEPTL